MQWTLTLSPQTWVVALLMIFISGKLLQQGGRMYGEGKPWMPDTIVGILMQLTVLLGTSMTLVLQNAQ